MARVHLVLVRPRRPENIGAVARVAANTGLAGLRLVAPGDWRTVEAFRMAWQAEEFVEQAREFDSLAEAVADCGYVAGLSGRGGDRIRHLTPRELAGEIAALDPESDAAVVFGNESSGLSLAERTLCQRQVRIPAAPRQPSLNLAQAAMVAGYEIFLAGGDPVAPTLPRARSEVSERALGALRDAMLSVGFLTRQKPEARFVEWRELFGRRGMTEREARLLMAFARRVRNAGRTGQGAGNPLSPHR